MVQDVPIVLVVEILVIVVLQDTRAGLDKALERGAREELPIRLLDPPIDLSQKLGRLTRPGGSHALEKVGLAIEGVEEWVQARRDEPSARHLRHVELVGHAVRRGRRIAPLDRIPLRRRGQGAFVRPPWHAPLRAESASIELTHDVVFEGVPTLDLTGLLIRRVAASYDAGEVRGAVGVQDTLRKLGLALAQQTRSHHSHALAVRQGRRGAAENGSADGQRHQEGRHD
mmetsp:Transcript_482/g.1222  ORF Transcript_482/g.1222 Transcript_482/m.1222 type:complete len:228 (-) Transcript_482:86-769(-)